MATSVDYYSQRLGDPVPCGSLDCDLSYKEEPFDKVEYYSRCVSAVTKAGNMLCTA
jgi:hypothetical protein